jgi:hypothetical protein
VLAKSRQRLTKSSEGARGFGERVVKDDSDTFRDRGGGVIDMLLQVVLAASKPPVGWFLRFGPHQNLVGVSAGIGGGVWRHREACVEVKQSHEEPMATGCLISNWTILPLD